MAWRPAASVAEGSSTSVGPKFLDDHRSLTRQHLFKRVYGETQAAVVSGLIAAAANDRKFRILIKLKEHASDMRLRELQAIRDEVDRIDADIQGNPGIPHRLRDPEKAREKYDATLVDRARQSAGARRRGGTRGTRDRRGRRDSYGPRRGQGLDHYSPEWPKTRDRQSRR
ncbi:hypothetical protein MKZ38_004109 [Zalerion maritima]|uniref:Uncharacterized protein n=1 Tax=Zalerion maritima TaxID=339359 RepID=A0AAD5WWI1_9PEZI|nr:hypothetical protein MKZ38_004109 [Zalerion maritima]